jgi:hypothetical protein
MNDYETARSLIGRIVTLTDGQYEDHEYIYGSSVYTERVEFFRVVCVDEDEDIHLFNIDGTVRKYPVCLVDHLEVAHPNTVAEKLAELREYVEQHKRLMKFVNAPHG